MARARNIKPAFFTNDHLADVHPLGRLLFIGLWTVADREGRLEDRPRRIKAEVLPYDDVDCDSLLNQLAEHGFILRYSVDSKRFIQVLKFNKHQNPHMKEAASVIPAPDLTGAGTVQAPDLTETSPADSLNPLTDSLNRIPDTPTPRKRDTGVIDEHFAKFWQSYPKKAGKQPAAKAFAKVDWRKVEFTDVMAALEQHKQSAQWLKDDGQFVPNASTWLNQERWTDELRPSIPAAPKNSDRITSVDQLFAEGVDDESTGYPESSHDFESSVAVEWPGQSADPGVENRVSESGFRAIAGGRR